MHRIFRLLLAVLIPVPAGAAPARPVAATGWQIPIEVKKLPNGLTVAVSEDHTAPTFGMSTAYRIGFRLEPKGRTGFAHLFEHMMFEGTPVSPKGTLTRVIEGGGGVLNGSTRYDYTNYIASAPTSALDAILWLEADRMKQLDFSEKNLKNQQEVVKEEIRVNVKNRPYGLFFWTDLASKAFDKWENAHDGYGSFEDLDAASLPDVEKFYETYYGPNNAVMALVGDLQPAEVFAKVEKYFGALPSRPVPPPPDVSEGLNTAERKLVQTDALARVPGGLQDAGPRQPRPRAGRGPRRSAPEWRGLTALSGPGQGQGAAPPDRGRDELAPRRRVDLQRTRAHGHVRALQADDQRQRGGRGDPGGDREDRERRRSRGRPRPRQDEDALGLLFEPRAADVPRRRDRPRPAHHG